MLVWALEMHYTLGPRMLSIKFRGMSLLWSDYKVNQHICSSFLASGVTSHIALAPRRKKERNTPHQVTLKLVLHRRGTSKGTVITNL